MCIRKNDLLKYTALKLICLKKPSKLLEVSGFSWKKFIFSSAVYVLPRRKTSKKGLDTIVTEKTVRIALDVIKSKNRERNKRLEEQKAETI